jgi:hypothetical protein
MVVHNFNAVSVSVAPHKADTPLVVDTYAVLPVPVTAERLQPIRGRGFQIFEFGSGLNHSQFSARHSLDIAEPSAVMAQADLFGFLAAKRLYHRLLYRASCNVEQYSAIRAGPLKRGPMDIVDLQEENQTLQDQLDAVADIVNPDDGDEDAGRRR